MVGFNRMISFEEASNRLVNVLWNPIQEQDIDITGSLGLVSASDVESEIDYPLYDRSAVDGYALDFRSTSGASEYNPISLDLVGTIEAGQSSELAIDEKNCCEIFTGGIMPKDADAVIMAEDSTRDGDRVLLQKSVRKFENVSRKGEDIPKGMIILKRGEVITAPHVASLIAAGKEHVKVFKKIRLGILSTGNEITRSDQSGIRNTTQPLLLGHFKNSYVDTIDLGVTGDSKEEILKVLSEKIGDIDVLAITGGSSLGEYDNVPEVLDEIGEPIFGGVLIKPGRTASLYNVDGKPVFSLSGLPVAALISFDSFFEVYLKAVMTIRRSRPRIWASLTSRVVNRGGMRSFLRVHVFQTSEGISADPLRVTGSGTLSTLLRANGIVEIPENIQGIEEGELVEVAMIGDID